MLRALATAAGACALLPGAALADAPGLTASLPPYDYAGFQSHLILTEVGPAGGFPANHVPNSFAIYFAQGFGFDPKAVSTTCSTAQADPNNNTCPTASRIGRGVIDVTLSGALSGNDQAQITLFEMPPQAPGDIAGVAFYFFINDTKNQFQFQGTSVGDLKPISGDPQFGATIDIPKLNFPTIPGLINITLNDMKLDVGAPDFTASQFTVTSSNSPAPVKRRHKHHKRKHHKRHVSKKHARHAAAAVTSLNPKPVAHSLLTNPPSCAGSWPIRVSWGYSDGVRNTDAGAPCSAAPQ